MSTEASGIAGWSWWVGPAGLAMASMGPLIIMLGSYVAVPKIEWDLGELLIMGGLGAMAFSPVIASAGALYQQRRLSSVRRIVSNTWGWTAAVLTAITFLAWGTLARSRYAFDGDGGEGILLLFGGLGAYVGSIAATAVQLLLNDRARRQILDSEDVA